MHQRGMPDGDRRHARADQGQREQRRTGCGFGQRMQAQPGGRDEERRRQRELAPAGDMDARSRERETRPELHGKRRHARASRGEIGTFPSLVDAHHNKRRRRGGKRGERK
jgi:hypothetical protein